MSFFPFFRDITGVSGFIIGGGKVALRKAEKLLPYGAKLTVIAPNILPAFQKIDVGLIERQFCENDLANAPEFVIAACDDRELNQQIALLCRKLKIPVNVVDQPECCTFLFPALVQRGDLSIGISTSGASPSAAVWIKEEIERLLPAHMEQSLKWMKEQRIAAKAQMGEEALRGRYLKQLFSACMRDEIEHPAPGRVFLVGAGCGSKGWITVEGLSLLKHCDVVVYDDLIDPGLLAEVSPAAETIYVGKRSHRNSTKQEQIQKLLVRLAKAGKTVVRLKGGDPFVFGRGGEEIQYLNQHQIPWRVIPGISSALAIPAEAGIPVTHRGVSRSIHIMTAHTRDDTLRRDMEQFAMLEGTLVFLMGLESLEMIVAILTENGRSVDTPAAILSGGNVEHPCKITGNLGNIVGKAERENAVTPAVIIVGDVVALDFYRKEKLPLSKITVGLTGTDDFQDKLRQRLLPLGAAIVPLMRGRCEAAACAVPWDQITDARDKWLVFTSVQGIRHFFRQQQKEKIDHRRFASCRFAAIGAATGRELENYGFTADLCPDVYTSAALAGELLQNVGKAEPVYLFCSKQGTEQLMDKMQEAQVECHRFDLYDTCFLPNSGRENALNPAEENALDYVLFGSAGGVQALYRSGYRMQEGSKGICIGPVCAEAYRQCFRQEPAVAGAATVEAMGEALLGLAMEAGQ